MTKEECRRLVACGYAEPDHFRGMAFSYVHLQMRVNPADVSALQLLEHVKALDTEANRLLNITAALDVIDEVRTLFGQDSAAQDLLPKPSGTVVPEWGAVCGWLTDGEGSLTHWRWDEVRSLMKSGAQDGFRVERVGATLCIAAAHGAASYLIEECLPRTDATSVLDLAVRTFFHEVRWEVKERLGVDENAGQRRLFHVEHTVAHGAAVYVFEAWTRRLVLHSKMTDLLRKSIQDPDGEDSRALRNIVFIYQFECTAGRLGNP